MLHHLSGQIKRPFPSDLRIFSKNIGNQAVLIVFNDASRDGKIPKRLAHRAAEHNPGRIEDTTKLIQKKYLGNLGLSVFPAFHEKPFFLYYVLQQPHVPRAPHHRFVGKSGMGPRGDALLEADWCVGELIRILNKNGLLENTLIVFSSDNGPVLNDGYKDGAVEMLGNHKPTGEMRGGKYSLFEAGTRVPFFVFWKNHINPIVSDALVSQMDLLASFADLIDADIPKDLDSENLLDVFMGNSVVGRKSFITEAMGRLAYRKGDYMLIPPYKGEKRNLTGNELGIVDDFSLFNLKTDIGQTNDLSEQEAKLTKNMKSEFLSRTKGYYNPENKGETLK